ncbi:MAG: DUF1549 and DUF1553 domain-containing protein [Isosphaeraceae bacterium]
MHQPKHRTRRDPSQRPERRASSLPALALAAGLIALPAPPSRGGGSEPTQPPSRPGTPSYRNDVVPLLSRSGCNMGACHGNASGKGGFRLSLRGEDPAFDHRSLTRDLLARRIDPAAPERSLVVLKPSGRLPHEGGVRFAGGSPEARVLIDWIAAGAPDDIATAPRLKALEVAPGRHVAAFPGSSVPLRVVARFDDGSRRDVTRQAAFDLSDPTFAEVSPEGLVVARRAGELTVAVRFLQGRGVSRLAFVPDRPGFAWSGPVERNVIDAHVFRKLRTLKVRPSAPSGDGVFLRRAYLDALGRLPTADEARAFLEDRAPAKRDRLVETLVERPEFADFWALKWADVLRNEEKTMGPKGVWVFQRWLRDRLAADAPLDEMVRQLISARGTTWTNPATSFYRTNRDPTAAAEAVAQVFLGIRLQCARCHNHPFDDWTQDDYYGLAAYFSNIRRKELNNLRKDRLDKHEINGDEVVFVSGPAAMIQPRSGARILPTPLGGRASGKAEVPGRALEELADWLTRDNRQFARNLANRVWFHLLGRGIVEPVDDFRASNPPSNPELLEALTDHLIRGGMRLRPLVALIMKSQTYGLSATPDESNADDQANFSRASVRLLPAEVLLDAIGQVLDVPERFPGAPARLRAVQFPGVGSGPFLKVFGKPERQLACECERNETTTLAQAFQMINGESVRRKLESPDGRLARRIAEKAGPDAILEELYLGALCRMPSGRERAAMLAHVSEAASPAAGWQDVAWAVLNSKEFLLRH